MDKSKTDRKNNVRNHPTHMVVQNRLEKYESRLLYLCVHYALEYSYLDVRRLRKGSFLVNPKQARLFACLNGPIDLKI